jgi:hypothetical protein
MELGCPVSDEPWRVPTCDSCGKPLDDQARSFLMLCCPAFGLEHMDCERVTLCGWCARQLPTRGAEPVLMPLNQVPVRGMPPVLYAGQIPRQVWRRVRQRKEKSVPHTFEIAAIMERYRRGGTG